MNPHLFFNRFSGDMPQWLADICDEVAAKGPQTSVEWRRLFCDLLDTKLYAGESNAFHFVHLSIRSTLEWAEKAHDAYDEARCKEIVTGGEEQRGGQGAQAGANGGGGTGTGGVSTGTGSETTGNGTPTEGGSGSGTGGTGAGVTGGGCSGGWGQGTTQGPGTNVVTGTGTQGTLFVVRISQFRAALPNRRKRERQEFTRLNTEKTKIFRRTKAQKDLLDDIDLVSDALPALEDLAQKHRTKETATGVLEAAGMAPEDIGLTDRAVAWLDGELKAG